MATSGLSDSEFEVLRTAVNIAKQYQLHSSKALRDRLLLLYPNRESDISGALNHWSREIRRNHPDGVSAFG